MLACVLVQFTKELGRDQLSVSPPQTPTHSDAHTN